MPDRSSHHRNAVPYHRMGFSAQPADIAGVAVRVSVGGAVRFTETANVVFGLAVRTEKAGFAEPRAAPAGEA